MDPAIIIKYGNQGYITAKREIHSIMNKLGDPKADEELLAPSFIAVRTKLEARYVIEEARELFLLDPRLFSSTSLWIPINFWCSVDEIFKIVKEDISPLIMPDEEYSIEILKHNNQISDDELISKIVPLIRGKPGYNPVKTIRIQIVDKNAAISLLKPTDIFKLQE